MESSSCLLRPLPLTGQELVRDLVIIRNVPSCLLGGEEAASPVKSQRPREFQKQRSAGLVTTEPTLPSAPPGFCSVWQPVLSCH